MIIGMSIIEQSGSTLLSCRSLSLLMEQHPSAVEHFTDIASRYDDLYRFQYDHISDLAIKHLQLKPDDHLADIGTGAGGLTHLIWKKASLFLVCALWLSV